VLQYTLYGVCSYVYIDRFNCVTQNLKAMLATSMYSVLENLYFSVVRNFGFTSNTNDFMSSATFSKNSSFIYVPFSISLFQMLTFLRPLAARSRLAPAISLGLYLRSEASSSAIS